MTRVRTGGIIALVVLCLLGAAGCGRRGPRVEFVEGRVLLDGQPVAGATVGFSPAGGSGLAAYGNADDGGTYRLTTTQGGRRSAGAPIGSYIVTVRKYRNRILELGPCPDSSKDPQGAARWNAEAHRLSELPPESLLPEHYGDPAVSPLRASVARGRNVGPAFTFELTSASQPPQGRQVTHLPGPWLDGAAAMGVTTPRPVEDRQKTADGDEGDAGSRAASASAGPWPGIVLVHGGGGTAFPE